MSSLHLGDGIMMEKQNDSTDSYLIDLTLTEKEKASNDLLNTIDKLPVHKITSKEEVLDWLNSDSDDNE